MKIKCVSLAILAALSVGMSAANAASTGNIVFKGELTDTTCEVNVNGQGSDATVRLPTVSISELVDPGSTSGRTLFTMSLTNCTVGSFGGHNKVAAFFQPGTSVDESTGRLKNIEGNAERVELQLLDGSASYSPINVGNTDQISNMKYVDIETNGTAVLPYAVEYYATGPTTPGLVTSHVVYNLQYQ